jgi:hypothetical protein
VAHKQMRIEYFIFTGILLVCMNTVFII